MRKFFLLCLFIISTFSGCVKDEPVIIKEYVSISRLLSRRWKIQEIKVNGQLTNPEDTYRLTMNEDKTYSETSAGGSRSGTWILNADQSVVIIGEIKSYVIISLSATEWKTRVSVDRDRVEITFIPE